jgi:excisionase family DNA binding protein
MIEIPNKPTLRIDEAMKVLSCSKRHVYHLVEDGSLNALDIRRDGKMKPAYRILRESLVELIQKKKTIP